MFRRNLISSSIIFALCALLLIHGTAYAEKITSTILESGSVSWDGGSFAYPKEEPEISIQKITVQTDGKEVIFPVHCHPVPLAGYVLKGSVKVTLKSTGKSKLFKAGDALIEVSNTWHSSVFTEDTELLVFYAGKKGLPLSVKQSDDSPFATVCR